jgi:L-malate glycosyltransferase
MNIIVVATSKMWFQIIKGLKDSQRTLLTLVADSDNIQDEENLIKIKMIKIPFFKNKALQYPVIPLKEIINFEPDIIHVTGEPSYLFTFAITRIKNKLKKNGIDVKITCRTAQNVYQNFIFPFNLIEKYNLNKINSIFYLSKDAKNVILKKNYRNHLFYLPNFYREDIFYVDIKEKKFNNTSKFLYVGNFIEKKGIIEITKAFDLISNLNWEMTFVGKGKLKDYLVYWSTKHNGKVKIIDFVEPKNLREIYLQSDSIILFSKDDINRSGFSKYFKIKWKEQFGRVIIEAMATGTTTIGSDSGEIPNIIASTGYICEQGNEVTLSDKIEYLITTKENRNQKNIIRLISESKKYSNENIVNIMINAWEFLINGE